jgi:hypothetical protein
VINIAKVTGDIVITAVAEVSAPAYTNLATSFQEGYRLNSSGTTSAEAGLTTCLDYIPFTNGTVVRVKGFGDLRATNSVLYKADKSKYHVTKISAMSDFVTYSYDSTSGIVTATCKSANVGFIRVSGKLSGKTSDVIITVNEPIS